MASKSEIARILRDINTHRSETVYGLSDGQIYIDGSPTEIVKIATDKDLEIFTFKGPELSKPQKTKDATGN